MWIRATYVLLAFVSLAITQLPLYLASIDFAHSSYCDTDVWFELGKGALDTHAAIVGASFVFSFTYVFLIAVFEAVAYALRHFRKNGSKNASGEESGSIMKHTKG